jgi:hypothetical protein
MVFTVYRITQLVDFSIVLDQSRFCSSTDTSKQPLAESSISNEMQTQYAVPLPSGAIFTIQDCSSSCVDVIKLQEEFGFEYEATIGSLIYLMNTCVRLAFAIRKLAKFMQYLGKIHFKCLKHLLLHIQCHRCTAGIKFYSDIRVSPQYQCTIDIGHTQHAEAPFIQFSNSSFQDCPDTARSPGGYLTIMQGGVIEAVSTMSNIVSHSCEAEYCFASIATMSGSYIRNIHGG